jgi:Fe2+ or Zn2+ uptake regulation protein
MLQGGKEVYFSVEEIYEALKADASYKDTDISLRDVIQALIVLETNGLVKSFSNGEDIRRLSVTLVTPTQ